MKKFIKQIILFFIIFGLIFLVGILLPATPRSKNNMLSYKIQKDSLLQNVKAPRIIFIGGSNLVFGLNSHMIKDSLDMNPINAGLAINLGLIYMMDDVLPYIKKGDIVILAPEYQLYLGKAAYGNNDLFRLLMDVDRAGFYNLRLGHLPKILATIPNYVLSKFKIKNYFYDKDNDVYGRHIFNEYGDSDFHWELEKREFPLLKPIEAEFNYAILDELKNFNNEITAKSAVLMITYPGCQNSSLVIIKDQVDKIHQELIKTDLIILGTPQRYSIPNTLMFDSPYHLSKKGVELRTNQLINDLKKIKDLK